MRGFGIGRMKGGWSRVVGNCFVWEVCGLGSPSCGISRSRAWWSLKSVRMIVVIVAGGFAFVGMRSNQWSSGELVGVKVGRRGSPKCVRDVLRRKSARGLWYDWCGVMVACRSPPRRTGVVLCSVVIRFCNHCRVSWYVWVSDAFWC